MAGRALSGDEVIGESVGDAFARVWNEVLPGRPLDLDLTWSEAGVDSLKSLQLLLRLEEVLRRDLSFDLFARDLTPGDLIRRLEAAAEPAAEFDDDAPRTLFLAPGIFGDEPCLADFRRAVSGQIACVMLTLPELDCPPRLMADMRATARLFMSQIVANAPEGPVAIAGYSFGGLVAYQAAADLVAAGRQVDLLCLLDAIPAAPGAGGVVDAPEEVAKGSVWARMRKRPDETLFLYLERIAFGALMGTGHFELARRLARASWRRYGFDRRQLRRRTLLTVFRGQAIRSWSPPRFDEATLLVASEPSVQLGLDRYWSELCRDLTIVPVSADHRGLFDPKPLTELVPALLNALGLAPQTGTCGLRRSA